MARTTTSFGLRTGRKVGPCYVIESLIAAGSEGEVYQVRELQTGILRAAKFYFPRRDGKRRLPIRHAHKLNALRHCHVVLQYHHSEIVTIQKQKVAAMISELCEGQQLEKWVAQHPGGRLHPFKALHVLHDLVCGLAEIHAQGQYHSDVHSQNILIQPRGVRFDMKLIDFYDWGSPTHWKQQQDIVDAVKLLHECVGGAARYARLPPELKWICSGLKRSLILKRFRTMNRLREHLASFEWTTMV